MTRSHAKNNTTQSTLTYYERSLLRAPNAARRIGQDSMKPLDSCNLCLSNVHKRSPTACSRGHLYCRECILSDLISQKAGIEASRREVAAWEDRERREREEAVKGARERVLRDFERGMGLSGTRRIINPGSASGSGGSATATATTIEPKENGVKPGGAAVGEGIKVDTDRVERLAKEAEEKALQTIAAEQLEARKAKLAAFWLPSLAPEAKMGPVENVKLQTMCHVGKEAHPISRKTLLPVVFTYPPTPATTTLTGSLAPPKPICPSCSRDLSNSTTTFLLSSRSPATSLTTEDEPKKKKSKKAEKDDPYVCGHVVCKTCVETIVRPSGRCCVCEAKVDDEGIITLGKEGTGFAAAGGAEVKKDVMVFRV